MMTDMFLQIDNSKAGKYAFALTGRVFKFGFKNLRIFCQWFQVF